MHGAWGVREFIVKNKKQKKKTLFLSFELNFFFSPSKDRLYLKGLLHEGKGTVAIGNMQVCKELGKKWFSFTERSDKAGGSFALSPVSSREGRHPGPG